MAVEDFTTYDEVDPNNHIGLVGTNHIDFDCYENETAHRYKDYGIDYFGSNWQHKINIEFKNHSVLFPQAYVWFLGNEVGSILQMYRANKTFLMIGAQQGWTNIMRLQEAHAGGFRSGVPDFHPVINTPYYLTITKVGIAVSCAIYLNIGRAGAPEATLNLALLADHKFKIVAPAITNNTGIFCNWDVDIENLDLGAGWIPPPTGRGCHGCVRGLLQMEDWLKASG